MRLPPPIGSQLPGAGVAGQRDDGVAVRLAHHRVAVEGIALGRVLDQAAAAVEGGDTPPAPSSRSSMTMAYSQAECRRPPLLSVVATIGQLERGGDAAAGALREVCARV